MRFLYFMETSTFIEVDSPVENSFIQHLKSYKL